MNTERDRFIVEWFGEKWHEVDNGVAAKPAFVRYCTCGKRIKHRSSCVNPDLSTAEGFQKVWGWMRTTLPAASVLWRDFLVWLDERDSMPAEFQVINLIDSPPKFADAVWEFLKGESK